MATSTLKILREINDYTQEYIAEDVLGISQPAYARIEQSPDKISAQQAQKLADLYKVSISNLLSESTPIVTFQNNSINNNHNAATNGYTQSQNVHYGEETINVLKQQNQTLLKQNTELMDLVKALGGKLLS